MTTHQLLLLSLFATAVVAPGRAQEKAEVTPPPADQRGAAAPATPVAAPAAGQASPDVVVKAPTAPQTGAVTKTDAGKDTLSVDFPDEEIRNILRNVADLFELNLVIPEQLKGKSSIKLRDVTWRQIFREVLIPVGYTFQEKDNIITIVLITEMNVQQETIIVPVTSGSLAEAKQAADSIVTQPVPAADGKSLSPGGRVIALTGASSLQITDTPEKLAQVRETLSTLSRANSSTNTRQVLIETKFFDVTEGNIRQLGVDFSKVASVDGSPLTIINGSRLTGAFTTAIYDSRTFDAAITALQTDNKIKLVTNPMIVTQQNRKAEIFEKTTIRYFVPVPTAQGAVPSPPDIKEIEVKTGLTVTPSIIDSRDARGNIVESLIQMLVTPEVSSLGANDTYTGGDGTSIAIPRVNSRTTTTNVVLKNGYTLVLGGLVKTQVSREKTKTPLLGDIPGLGILFRQTKDSIEYRTLLTFITARIITPDGQQPDAEKNRVGSAADFDLPARRVLTNETVRALDIGKQDLPGYIKGESPVLPDKASTPPKTKL